jgi:hypothetical protein
MMKKICLFLLAIICSSGSIFSQANYVVQAPLYDGSSTRISAPSGLSSQGYTQYYQRSVFLVTQSELGLMALTNSVIAGFGFDMRFGTSAMSVAGSFTVYLQNTTDVTYNKGLNFTSALSGMSQCYAGNMTIPRTTGYTTMGVNLANTFTYTGGGIYVAYDWATPGPYDNVGAWTLANSSNLTTGGATCEGPTLPALATMTTTAFRPVFRFSAGNIATNDVAVTGLTAPGTISKLENTPELITAVVKNQSAGTLSNINVTLNIAGANSFNNVQTIPSLASGGTTIVNFAGFSPATSGINTVVAVVAADQNTLNNGMAWTQSVTCAEIGNNPPGSAATFSDNSLGTSGSGIISTRYTIAATCSLNAIKLAVANTTINIGQQVYGVLLDATGNIIATSNTLTLSGAMLGTYQNFNFSPPQALSGGSDYFLGIAIPAGPAYPCGTTVFDPYTSAPGYFFFGINGGNGVTLNYGYIGIQAILGFSNTTISASASQTIVCKNDGPGTVTLTASGLTTFTWSPGGQGATIVVTPTVPGASGTANYNVTGTDGPSGCRSNATSITVSVSACTGLASNTSNGFDLKLYPNPAIAGKSTITGLVGVNSITVYNILGQAVLTKHVTEESTTLDLSNQPSGNYVVKITDSNNESRSIKIINQN